MKPPFNQHVTTTQPSLIRSMYQHVKKDSYIDLGLGELSYPIPGRVKKAMQQALEREGTNRYTPNAGLEELRVAIARDFNKKHTTHYSSSNVIVTAGSTEALFVSLFTFAAKESVIFIPHIHYPAYAGDATLLGLQVKEYLLTSDFRIDINYLVTQLNRTNGVKFIILNSPANPTGSVTDKSDLEQIFEAIKNRSDVYVLSDEIYSYFLFDGRQHSSFASYLPERTIVIDGVSKRASITGYRLGWMIAPEEIITQAVKVHAFAVTAASSLIQYGVLPVLQGECANDIERFRADLERKRDIMIDLLQAVPHVSMHKPSGAVYCFVNIAHYGSSLDVSKKLLEEANVVTIPGRAFGEKADDSIRLSFASEEHAIREGIKKMKGAFAQWHK